MNEASLIAFKPARIPPFMLLGFLSSYSFLSRIGVGLSDLILFYESENLFGLFRPPILNVFMEGVGLFEKALLTTSNVSFDSKFKDRSCLIFSGRSKG